MWHDGELSKSSVIVLRLTKGVTYNNDLEDGHNAEKRCMNYQKILLLKKLLRG